MDIPFHKKVIFVVIIFAGVFTIGIGAGYMIDSVRNKKHSTVADNTTPSETTATISQTEKVTPPEISLTFTGDITMNGIVKKNVREKLDGDYEKIFGAAKTILQKADITFGNFNGTFGINDPERTDSKVAGALQGSGFDVLGMSYGGRDRSVNNLIETSLVIDGNGVLHAGAGRSYENAREPKIIEKNGQTVGYLTFSDNKNDWPFANENDAGMLSADDPQLEEIISEAKAKSDILVVAFNWADKATSHTLRQELLSHTAIDSGATIVVGHYGNNLHDIEYYHGGLIAYNLGNLVRGNGIKPTGIQGIILETGIRAGVINTVNAYGVVENQNGFIDSVKEISIESLVRDKGVIKGNIRDYSEIVESLPPSVTQRSVFRGPKVNKVAITIDDGWNSALIKKALDILSVKNTTATFFTVGVVSDTNKLNLVRAVTNGIELGNHTDTHGWLTQMSDKQIRNEMDTWQKKIDDALGRHYQTSWFRPPFMAGFSGHTKTAERVTAIATERNMKIALWDVDPFTGISMRANAPAITNFVVSNARPGSIILLHFTNEHMSALPDIIDGLRKKGLEPVTLSELMGQ